MNSGILILGKNLKTMNPVWLSSMFISDIFIFKPKI